MCARILLVSAEIQRKIAESIEENTHTHTRNEMKMELETINAIKSKRMLSDVATSWEVYVMKISKRIMSRFSMEFPFSVPFCQPWLLASAQPSWAATAAADVAAIAAIAGRH